MESIIKEYIYEQNHELLQKIANVKYVDHKDKEEFIKKYHKKNFSYFKPVTKDVVPEYTKYLLKRVKTMNK
jgi:hypothetical protein